MSIEALVHVAYVYSSLRKVSFFSCIILIATQRWPASRTATGDAVGGYSPPVTYTIGSTACVSSTADQHRVPGSKGAPITHGNAVIDVL